MIWDGLPIAYPLDVYSTELSKSVVIKKCFHNYKICDLQDKTKNGFWEEDAHTETSCNQTLWQLVHRLTTDIVLSDNYPPMNKKQNLHFQRLKKKYKSFFAALIQHRKWGAEISHLLKQIPNWLSTVREIFPWLPIPILKVWCFTDFEPFLLHIFKLQFCLKISTTPSCSDITHRVLNPHFAGLSLRF